MTTARCPVCGHATAEPRRPTESPQALVAIARAAYLTGDRDLLKVVQQQLRQEFALEVRFIKQPATEAAR